MTSGSRTSRRAREEDAAEDELPSLNDRFKLAGQAAHPLARTPHPAPPSVEVETPKKAGKPSLSALPAGAHEGETIYAIPLELIDPNPYNARHIYREERVKEMALTLTADGQLQPGLATPRNGRYVLASGHYRFRGAKLAGIPTLDVLLRPDMSNLELFELSYKENNEREGQSALDNAISWERAIKDGLYENEYRLSEANGISVPTIHKTIALLKLPEDALEEVKLSPNAFGLSVLYELYLYSQLAKPAQTLEAAIRIRNGEMSRRDIEAARKAIENPKQRKSREGSRHYKILSGESQIGTIKEWDSGKVMLEVKLTDPSKRAELVSELCKRFGLTQGD
ncbi:MAG: ParB/RepB/Spo0J family partition protein [Proteobacteria bacterium]|nr:ParB/RepB/Spo0J family partition protein [Pseudomonadota bacterium]